MHPDRKPGADPGEFGPWQAEPNARVHDWSEGSLLYDVGPCGMSIAFRALVGGPHVDNPHTQPVELLCIEQVSALHWPTRISLKTLSGTASLESSR